MSDTRGKGQWVSNLGILRPMCRFGARKRVMHSWQNQLILPNVLVVEGHLWPNPKQGRFGYVYDGLRARAGMALSLVGLCGSFSFHDLVVLGAMTNVSAVLWYWRFIHGVETPWRHSSQSLDPHVVYVEPEIQSVAHFAVSIDEIQHMDHHIVYAMMIGRVEMMSYGIFHVPSMDHSKMCLKAFGYGVSCLPNILFFAIATCHAIYQVGTFACDITFAQVCLAGFGTSDPAAGVQSRAKAAGPSFAYICNSVKLVMHTV